MASPRAAKEFQLAVAEHRARLERVHTRRSTKRLQNLYDEANAAVTERLRRMVRGGKGDTFTAHQQRIALTQVRLGQRQLSGRLSGAMGEASLDTAHRAVKGLAEDVTRLHKRFTGAEITLPIEEASVFQGIVDDVEPSLIRMHQASFERYGANVTGKVEQQLSLSLLSGESPNDAMDAVAKTIHGEWWQGERIVRCLPGEALVTGAVVRAVHRHWYEGPMVEVVTEGGRHLTATPNHPMLTRRGWVLQGRLVKGDDLIRYRGKQDAGTPLHEDVARRPTTLAQVFDATAAVGVGERRRGRKPDFHGDGGEGEVYVARPDRELVYGVFAPLAKPASQHVFAEPDKTGSGGARFCTRCASLIPHERACFCQGADAYPHLAKATKDRSILHAVGLGDLRAAFSRLVAVLNLGQREVYRLAPFATRGACALGFRQGPGCPGSLEMPFYAVGGHAEAQRHLPPAESGEVELDRVLLVRRCEFAGHVFNLTTPHGYYAIDGFYTGNTELAYASNATLAGGISESAEEFEELMQQWNEHCDESGVPLDDRVGVDSIAMHGQVAPAGGLFTMPATAPFPDAKGETEVYRKLVGLQWQFPPSRPNCRAVLSPWMSSWGIPGWRYARGSRVPI